MTADVLDAIRAYVNETQYVSWLHDENYEVIAQQQAYLRALLDYAGALRAALKDAVNELEQLRSLSTVVTDHPEWWRLIDGEQ